MTRPRTHRIASAVRPAALVARALRPSNALTILGWHRVDPHGGGVSTLTDVFAGQLRMLHDRGAKVLPLREATRLLATGALPANAVVLTFDDGYRSVLDTALPLLEGYGYPATFFVVSGYLDGARHFPWDPDGPDDPRAALVTAAQVREAHERGLDIGSHTTTHRWLPDLAARELETELRRSRGDLEDLLGAPVETFAYPMGGWTSTIRDAVARAGYSIAVTTDKGVNHRRRDPLLLRRPIAPGSVEDLGLLLDGGYNWLRPVDRWRTRNGPIW